jgi:hypothetical protein
MKIFVFAVLLMPTLLFIDSQWLSQFFNYGQWLANALMMVSFLWIYKQSNTKLKKLMKYGVVISLCGELLFSLVFGMYEYRLENVPIYVPFGHAILYAAIFYWVEDEWVQKNSKKIIQFSTAFAIIYGLSWLYFTNDVYGFVCLIVLLAALYYLSNSKFKTPLLFPMSMFVLVAYLEQLGTRLECWYWPTIAFDKYEWLPSGNPPSAIGVFYLVFDALCGWLYQRRNKISAETSAI